MKKLLALLLCLLMVVPAMAMAEETEITLWTYPIGGWANDDTVQEIIANFNAVHPEIKVNVQYVDYQTGDDQVTTAIEAGTTPDIIFEGPGRLVALWGAAGKLLDVSDLWTEETTADILAAGSNLKNLCTGVDGNTYIYPLCMTTHCMVIDKAAFEKAGALQYIDLETRTWTNEQFEKACEALVNAGYTVPGIVYCGAQGGDQGTRALAYNLFNATFTNPDHTRYTMDSAEGQKGLAQLVDWVNRGLLVADPGIAAADAIALFCNGTTQMSFCWNAALLETNKQTLAEGVEPLAVAFPSEDGVPVLDGGMWGFGLFNNGDDAKVAAAKEFIKFVCDDPVQGPKSTYATGYFPTKASFGDIFTGTEKAGNADYAVFNPYLGDIYDVTPGWPNQRTEWWNLLQRLFAGGDVATEVAVYSTNVNK